MLRPLRHRDFRLLWTGQAVSLIGDGIYLVAIAWLVYDISNSPGALGLVGVAWTLPMVLTLLGAGVLSDRYDRRLLMIVADLLRVVAVGGLAALALAGSIELWHVVGAGRRLRRGRRALRAGLHGDRARRRAAGGHPPGERPQGADGARGAALRRPGARGLPDRGPGRGRRPRRGRARRSPPRPWRSASCRRSPGSGAWARRPGRSSARASRSCARGPGCGRTLAQRGALPARELRPVRGARAVPDPQRLRRRRRHVRGDHVGGRPRRDHGGPAHEPLRRAAPARHRHVRRVGAQLGS